MGSGSKAFLIFALMDRFIVSARKYRPQDFSSVVGQSHITTTLKNAIRNNQLAHAFLFCGPRGVGKTTCARILAKTINCENRQPDGEACNTCPSCISFNEGTSLNIHELDAASNNSVDDIRTLVEQVRFAPQAGKYKVYIIDEVHMLSASAFNAFLKTLEEPPPYAIFILATTEKHKILPTILSRCQIFDFKRITITDTVQHLLEICGKEEIKADKAALQVIAQKSEGCMRDALSILDKIVSFTNGELNYQNTLEHLNLLDDDYYFRLMDAMRSQNLVSAMLLYDEINRKGFEGDMVLNGFAEFIRNVLVCKDEKLAVLLETVEGFQAKYVALAKEMDPSYLLSALNLLNESEINYKGARNKRLHVELALIKLTYLAQALDLSEESEAVNKKKAVERVKPVNFRKIRYVGAPQPQQYAAPDQPARLIVETPLPEPPPIAIPRQKQMDTAVTATSVAPPPTLGALLKIRKQVAEQQKQVAETRVLDTEQLHLAWEDYITKLQAQKNHSAVSAFKAVTLRIHDQHGFTVVTENKLIQKFVEQERAQLVEHVQQFFNDKTLNYQVILEERPDNNDLQERPLNTREQFLKMAETYPLVKELKDRLRLELDY